jgi:hypothetical protein
MDSRAWMRGFPAAFTWSVLCRWRYRNEDGRRYSCVARASVSCTDGVLSAPSLRRIPGTLRGGRWEEGYRSGPNTFSSLSSRTRSRDGLCQYLLLRSEVPTTPEAQSSTVPWIQRFRCRYVDTTQSSQPWPLSPRGWASMQYSLIIPNASPPLIRWPGGDDAAARGFACAVGRGDCWSGSRDLGHWKTGRRTIWTTDAIAPKRMSYINCDQFSVSVPLAIARASS